MAAFHCPFWLHPGSPLTTPISDVTWSWSTPQLRQVEKISGGVILLSVTIRAILSGSVHFGFGWKNHLFRSWTVQTSVWKFSYIKQIFDFLVCIFLRLKKRGCLFDKVRLFWLFCGFLFLNRSSSARLVMWNVRRRRCWRGRTRLLWISLRTTQSDDCSSVSDSRRRPDLLLSGSVRVPEMWKKVLFT